MRIGLVEEERGSKKQAYKAREDDVRLVRVSS